MPETPGLWDVFCLGFERMRGREMQFQEHQVLEKREAERVKASEQAAARRKQRSSSHQKPQPKEVSKPTARTSANHNSPHRSKLVQGVTGALWNRFGKSLWKIAGYWKMDATSV